MNSKNFKRNKGDHTLSIIKAALSTAPFTGGLASLINDYIPSSIEKRKNDLLLKIEEDIKKLEKQFAEETLTKDYFISTFITAFKSALENHDKEKINSFRAIILNTLVAKEPKEDEIAMFVSMTQRLTPLHIKLLKILNNPKSELEKYPEKKAQMESVYSGGLSTLTSLLLPDYPKDLVEVAFQDLYNMGLQGTQRMGVTMTGHGITQKRTTEFGDRYLSFITLPEDLVE